MRTLIAMGLLVVGTAAAWATDEVQPAGDLDSKVVYGTDDRRDLYEVTDRKVLALADSTVALFSASDVSALNGSARLNTRSYGDSYNLCPEEPYRNQVNGAFCSGSLVGPDLIMTAGHCVTSEDACKGVKFVFGFAMKSANHDPSVVPAGEVYGCKQLLGREQVNDGADWALIKLDRPVANHAPLRYNRTGAVREGDPILVIGHPAGLPTKVAGGAKVRDAKPNGYYRANLDTYGGNSGSAVFSAETGEINGILVRGETDYVYKGSCRVSNTCADDACRGEDVTKLSSVPFPSAGSSLATRVAPFGATFSVLMEVQAQLGEGRL